MYCICIALHCIFDPFRSPIAMSNAAMKRASSCQRRRLEKENVFFFSFVGSVRQGEAPVNNLPKGDCGSERTDVHYTRAQHRMAWHCMAWRGVAYRGLLVSVSHSRARRRRRGCPCTQASSCASPRSPSPVFAKSGMALNGTLFHRRLHFELVVTLTPSTSLPPCLAPACTCNSVPSMSSSGCIAYGVLRRRHRPHDNWNDTCVRAPWKAVCKRYNNYHLYTF